MNIVFNIKESEKVLVLHSQIEQEHLKKSSLLSEVSLQSSEVAHLRAKESQLNKEIAQLREAKKRFEEDIAKIKAAHNADILQVFLFYNRVILNLSVK